MNLFEKIQWNLSYRFRCLRFRLLGRPIHCENCGMPVAKVIPRIRSGDLQLEGLELSQVYVDFKSLNILRFRHADPGECVKNDPNTFSR